MKPLEKRAKAAYYRSWDGSGSQNEPSDVETREHAGLRYVVLSNVNGTLAVYRVRTVNGEPVLKGMKRWPGAVAPAM